MRIFLLAILLFGILNVSLSADDKGKTNEVADPDSGMSLGRLLPTIEGFGHQTPIDGLFFTQDGKRLVSLENGRSGRMVCTWNVQSRERLKVLHFTTNRTISATAFAPDDKTLAVQMLHTASVGTTETYLAMMNIETGSARLIPSRRISKNCGLAFDPSGVRLLVAGDGSGIDWYQGMRAFWKKSPEETLAIKPTRTSSAADLGTYPFRLAFSPDKSKVAFVGRRGDTAGSLDGPQVAGIIAVPASKGTEAVKTAKLDDKLIHPYAVGWSPDGKQLAVGYENGVKVWDASGKLLREFNKKKLGGYASNAKTNSFQVHHLHFLNEDEIVLCWRAVRGDEAQPEIGVTILHQQRPTKTTDLAYRSARFVSLPAAAVSADGKWAAFAHGSYGTSFTLVDLKKGASHFTVGSETEAPSQVAWGRDGTTLLWNSTRRSDKTVPFQGINLNKMEYTRVDGLARLNAAENYKAAEAKLRESFIWQETSNNLFSVLQRTDANGKLNPLEIDLIKGKERIHLEPSYKQPITAYTVSADPAKKPWTLVGRNGLVSYDVNGKLTTYYSYPSLGVQSLTSAPDGRLFAAASMQGFLQVYNVDYRIPLVQVYASGEDWVIWARNGYYASSPNGDKFFGWLVDDGYDKAARFIPAARLRDTFHRPDIIQALLKHGSMALALKEVKAVAADLEKNLPPHASLTVTSKETGVFEVEATAATTAGSQQKITSLHLLFDGRPIKLGPDNYAVKKFAPSIAETKQPVHWTVKLDPGVSGKLSARAHSEKSYAFSNEVAVDVPAPMMRKKGTLYYFGVGVSVYAADKGKTNPQWKLDWSQKDVDDLGVAFQNDIVPKSHYQGFVAITLTNEKATKRDILAKLDELKETLKPADLLVMHFSSHGERDGAEGGLYLLPHDWNPEKTKETGLSGDRLQECFSAYPCPVLLMLDACHSGAMKSPSEELLRKLSDERTGVTVMTAALSYQKAEEHKDLKNGVFTAGLLEGMRSAEAIDPFTRRQYAHNLFAYAFSFVNRETNGRQMPSFSQSGAVPPIVLREGSTLQTPSP